MRYLTTDLAGEDVLTGRTGALGLIALNRPRIINSLSLPMVRQIEAAELMEQFRITSLLVVDGAGVLTGCLNTNDLMRAKVI